MRVSCPWPIQRIDNGEDEDEDLEEKLDAVFSNREASDDREKRTGEAHTAIYSVV